MIVCLGISLNILHKYFITIQLIKGNEAEIIINISISILEY